MAATLFACWPPTCVRDLLGVPPVLQKQGQALTARLLHSEFLRTIRNNIARERQDRVTRPSDLINMPQAVLLGVVATQHLQQSPNRRSTERAPFLCRRSTSWRTAHRRRRRSWPGSGRSCRRTCRRGRKWTTECWPSPPACRWYGVCEYEDTENESQTYMSAVANRIDADR